MWLGRPRTNKRINKRTNKKYPVLIVLWSVHSTVLVQTLNWVDWVVVTSCCCLYRVLLMTYCRCCCLSLFCTIRITDMLGLAYSKVVTFAYTRQSGFVNLNAFPFALFLFHSYCPIVLVSPQRQFPREFEFNEKMLLTLADHQYTCRYGTFM